MDQLWHSQIAVALIVTAVPSVSAQPLDLRNYEIVDLTHSLNEKTLFWPTSPSGFKLESLSHGVTPGGWFYAANTFCTPEHGGTHLDAPIHFDSTGMTVEKIPLDRLVAPAIVIDVVDACAKDDDYRLTVADVQRFEKQHGKISAGTIVILRTGWEHFWPDRKNYFGDDTPNDASRLHFPSFGAEAARHAFDRLRAIDGLHRPPHRRGAKRRGALEPARPRRPSRDRRHGVRPPDQDRRRLGRTAAGDRTGAEEALSEVRSSGQCAHELFGGVASRGVRV